MGFFSCLCSECNESIKAPYDLPSNIAWQNLAIAIQPDGNGIFGEYDGYGKIVKHDTREVVEVPEGCTWRHVACAAEMDSPDGFKYTEGSEYAADQGYFYERNEQELE
jgi:hypothetical protein